jgi:hypothetical protein
MTAREPALVSALLCLIVCSSFAGFAMDTRASEPEQARQTAGLPAADSGPSDPDDDMPDPRQQAAENAWKQYQQSLFDTLSHSPEARDWAMATLLGHATATTATPRPTGPARDELLRRAARAAPDDVLVQLVMARQSDPIAAPDAAAAAAAARKLQTLEPDNAEVWLDDVRTAALAKDQHAIDKALSRVAACRRFDSHYANFLRVMSDIYRRNPVADEYWSLASNEDKDFPREAAPFVFAMSAAAVAGLPSYQYLVNVCRVDPASAKNAVRSDACAAIGRTMIEHGDTLITNRMGHALLRVSRTFTDADLAAVRNFDWIYSKAARLMTDDRSTESIFAYQADWIDSNSETQAMRRRLVRNGIPTTPPDDWTDDSSPFSPERLGKDEAWLELNRRSPK